MNNNNENNLIQKFQILQQIQPSTAERDRVRGELEQYMNENTPVASDWMSVISPLQKIKKSAMVVALMFFVLGGVSLQAEDALPGDSLYAIKVNVNEKFMGITYLNNSVLEAENQSRFTSRRIAELEELAARGTLNPEISNRLTTAISKHTQSAREHIKAASEAGEVSAALSLETELVSTLNTHGDILEKLGVRSGGSQSNTAFAAATELRRLAQTKAEEDISVTVSRAQSIEVRTDSSSSLSPPQADKLLGRTADRLKTVREDFQGSYDTFTNDTFRNSLEELLLRAANEIDTAITHMDEGDYKMTKSSLQNALTYTHEVSIIIAVHESFDLSNTASSETDDLETATSSTSDTTTSTSAVQGTSTVTTSEADTEEPRDIASTSSSTKSVDEKGTSTAATSSDQATSSTATTSASVGVEIEDTADAGIFHAKKEWSTDSDTYTRITQVLERVDKTLQEGIKLEGGVLPSRDTEKEEN